MSVGNEMALVQCMECRKEISDQAVACPHCGCPVKIEPTENCPVKAEANKAGVGYGILPTLGVGVLIVVAVISFSILPDVYNNTSTNTTPRKTFQNATNASDVSLQDKKDLDEYVRKFKAVGFIMKIEPEHHNVWIETSFWNTTSADSKKTFMHCMGLYCADNSRFKSDWVNIYDYMNDKKIAEITGTGAYKIY
jgi:hypothetical protein